MIEIDEPPLGTAVRGMGNDRLAMVHADKTFEDATATASTAARSLIFRLRSINDPPDEVGTEFGVQLSARIGAFIASVAAQAKFRVSMTRRRGGAANG